MNLRLVFVCVLCVIVCATSIDLETTEIQTKYSIEQICERLVNYYYLIYQLVDIKIDLDFGDPQYLSLYGKGSVVLSPNIHINYCNSYQKGHTTLIAASFTDTLTIRFSNRPWLVIEGCEVEIHMASEPTVLPDEISLEVVKLDVVRFRRASANCSSAQIGGEEILPVLNAALAEYRRTLNKYYIDRHYNAYEFHLKRLLDYAFIQYMYKLNPF